MCCGHQQSLWYRSTAAVLLFIHVCVCVYVSVYIFCMWQIWDILDCCWKCDTPLQAIVFIQNLQYTPNHNLAVLVMRNHLAVVMHFLFLDHKLWKTLQPYYGYFSITIPDRAQAHCVYRIRVAIQQCLQKKTTWLMFKTATWWVLSTCSISLLHCICNSHMEIEPSVTRNNSQDVSVLIFPLHS